MQSIKTIVFKVGTSTLTYENGKLNLKLIFALTRVLSDLKNSGVKVVLVTSGAIGAGFGKLGITDFPHDIPSRQAAAAVGQNELMFIYDKFFSDFGHTIGQVLITKEDFEKKDRREHLLNNFKALLNMNVLPIVNENDAVATDEIVFGGNYIHLCSIGNLSWIHRNQTGLSYRTCCGSSASSIGRNIASISCRTSAYHFEIICRYSI